MKRAKQIAILGSGGALGEVVLGVVRNHPRRLRVVGLGTRRSLDRLAEQIQEFRPLFVASGQGYDLPDDFPLGDAEILAPAELVAHPDVEVVVVAATGAIELETVLTAVRYGKQVVLGNKEVGVVAGPLLVQQAQKYGATLIPMDSETTAVWQSLLRETDPPARLVIPSKWGPVLAGELGYMARVNPEALTQRERPPLGQKRAIDAATLMNKAMQVIEAHHLFGVPLECIQVLFHPQDRVRALVELRDGTMKSILASSDPRVAIQVALSFPERWENAALPTLTSQDLGELTFQPLEEEHFPCFRLAMQAAREGGTSLAALNAANETAVSLFLFQQIGFQDIPTVVGRVLSAHASVKSPTLKDIRKADQWAREFTTAQVPT